MMCALSVVVLALGAVFEALDLTAAALASICIAFIYIEVGAPYTFISWLCTTLLSFLFFPQSLLWIEYLLLYGIYPILKGYIEKLPRLGKKILATGNGKCNFTNLVQEDSCYRGSDASFSQAARTAFPTEQTISFFKQIGIEPKYRNGYVYPNSEQAASVADALVMELRAKKVKVIQETVHSVKHFEDVFLHDAAILLNHAIERCLGKPADNASPLASPE